MTKDSDARDRLTDTIRPVVETYSARQTGVKRGFLNDANAERLTAHLVDVLHKKAQFEARYGGRG